uniref:UEV domain-containing protein n=1 Tax=Neogobius melanostomus TaxID=47308 RepID=A0A8C6T2K4_9GOBI
RMTSKAKIRKMLPKAYIRRVVADDISAAMMHFKNLAPAMDNYVYNDGTTKIMMCLSGTISSMFNNKSYNIPVGIVVITVVCLFVCLHNYPSPPTHVRGSVIWSAYWT